MKTGFFIATFNLPDLKYRVPYMYNGVNIGHKNKGQLPNIIGETPSGVNTSDSNFIGNGTVSGVLFTTTESAYGYGADAAERRTYQLKVKIDASRSSDVYGAYNETGVVPRSLGINYIVKY